MAVDVLYQKKEELAAIYLEDLKKELGALQGRVVDLFSKRLKKRMVSDKALNSLDDLELSDQEKKVAALAPVTIEKIFAFVKEKQEKLANVKTLEELEALKKEMKPTVREAKPEAEEKSSKAGTAILGSTIGSAGLGADVLAIQKIDKLKEANKIKSIEVKNTKEFAEKMKRQFVAVARDLDKQAANPHLVAMQRKNIMQSAREFKAISTQIDEETMTSVEMFARLKNKLPASILQSISPKDADKLRKLSDATLLQLKQAKTDAELAAILEKQGIKNLNKEVMTVLKSADNVAELRSMTTVMKSSKRVLSFMRGMKGILVIDLIVTGINIFVLTGESSEAESYKKINKIRGEIKSERAWVQFGTTTALLALETIGLFAAFGSSLGPVGTVVGLVAGALTAAVSQAIDVYYDKVEFYAQNPEEFKQQYRTELKQAIISSAASEERNLNILARLEVMQKKAGAGWRQRKCLPFSVTLTEKDKITTTEDAWKSLIRQEEYTNAEYPLIQDGAASGQVEDEFKKTLSTEDLAEYEKEKTALNSVINARMAYIKKFMYGNKKSKEYQLFVSAMKNGMGIKTIEKILANSKVYYDMQQVGEDQYVTGCATVVAYKTAYAEKLKTDNATWFVEFETMRATDQRRFLELYHGVKNYEMYVFEPGNTSEDFPYKDKIDDMQKRIDFVKHYYAYKTLGVPIEDQQKMTILSPTIDNNQIQEVLISGNLDAAILNLNATNTKDYFRSRECLDRMESELQISDSLGQNIIYRIAVEFHGYTGDNTMEDLMAFFREDKGEALGLYYDNKWIINNDRAIDKSIDIDDFDTMTTEEILEEWISPNNWNRALELLGPGSVLGATGVYSVFGFMDEASMIDTKAEAGDMDEKMNAEYLRRLQKIITEEKAYKLPENKKKIEQSVVDFIQKNSREVGKTITYDPVTQEAIHSEDKEQGYVEIPYYLVVQAKKAGIGDLRKYIFKYENNQIVACTNQSYLTDKLDFSQTNTNIKKEYVSSGAESLPKNAQKYIDYVDQAENKFEKFITFDEDELDIPKEYLKIYQGKIDERKTFKKSLLTLDPSTAKSELASKYQDYHDYFEDTYMAMLSVISKFGINAFSSNDLDSAQHHQQIAYMASQLKTFSVDEKTGDIAGPISNLTEVQQKFFKAIFGTLKYKGKLVKDLAKSSDGSEREKAFWVAKQVVKSILEAEILEVDAQGNIENIGFGEGVAAIKNMKSGVRAKRLERNFATTREVDVSVYPMEEATVDESKIAIKLSNAA